MVLGTVIGASRTLSEQVVARGPDLACASSQQLDNVHNLSTRLAHQLGTFDHDVAVLCVHVSRPVLFYETFLGFRAWHGNLTFLERSGDG